MKNGINIIPKMKTRDWTIVALWFIGWQVAVFYINYACGWHPEKILLTVLSGLGIAILLPIGFLIWVFSQSGQP